MGERYVREVYNEDLHMGNSADGDGSHRALEFDDDGNLKGHAKLYEVDEKDLYEELHEKYKDDDTDYIPQIDIENLEHKLQMGAFVAGFLREAAPDIKVWIKQTAVPGAKAAFSALKEKLRKKAREDTENIVEASVTETTSCLMIANEIEVAEKNYRKKMTSKEAQQRLLRLVIKAMELSKELNELADAEILDSQALATKNDQLIVEEALTKESLIEGINNILVSGEDSFSKEQIEILEELLNRGLYRQGEYVPISEEEIRDVLNDGGHLDNADKNDGTEASKS